MSDVVRDHEAHHKIDSHEKVCAERYGNLWSAVQRIERNMEADRASRAALDRATHARFNTISNRMWLFLAAVSGTSIAAVGAMAWELLKKGH
jgi:hypothetical protein